MAHMTYIGIDEAGRGPLAGPVVVAGVRLMTSDKKQAARILKDIRDSKKLTEKQREKWFSILTAHPQIQWATAVVSPRVVDRMNIARAANLGAWRVYKKLIQRADFSFIQLTYDRPLFGSSKKALLDGSLYLPPRIPYETIIKGDEKVPIISAASIIAKVTRDRIMRRLHKKYPQYGLAIHKGYGTYTHRIMIRTFGLSPVHRVSFRVRENK